MKKTRSILTVFGLLCLSFPCSAQTNGLFGKAPPPNAVPTNAVLRFAMPPQPSPISLASVTHALLTPTPKTNFLAVAYDSTQDGFWPDVAGTIGKTNCMTMLQKTVRIQDRTGLTNATFTLDDWWGGQVLTFDPRIVFDPYYDGGRWISVAGGNAGATNAFLLVAVSKTPDPTGPPATTWYRRSFPADAGQTNWADFPQIGFNKDWIVVTANLYPLGIATGFQAVRLWIFNKTNFYAGGTNAPTILTDTNAQKAFNLTPSLVYDNTSSNMYLLTVWNTNTLRVYAITGAISNERLVATTDFPCVETNKAWAKDFGDSGLLNQKDSAQRIFAADDRFLAPVIQRNGFLWATHHIFLPYTNVARTAVQWWKIGLANCTPEAVGRIEDDTNTSPNTISYAYPSIAVNRFNDVLIGYSRFSTNQYASGNYAYHDLADSQGEVRSDTVLTNGLAYFTETDYTNRIRWGDFSSTVVDPVNDTDLWTLQQYARPTNYVSQWFRIVSQWGTHWGQIAPAVPGNDYFTNASTLASASGTINGTVKRGTTESGEPNHGGSGHPASAWYRWTAPTNGWVVFDLPSSASGLQSVLAVYTGTKVSGLTLKTNSTGYNPKVLFNASSNTTYQVAVAGPSGPKGDFTLHYSQAVAPLFVFQPASSNLVANANEDAILVSLAIGTPDPVYQWRFYGTNSSPATNDITGATNATYTITNVQGTNAGNYFVVATNLSGKATSDVATLFIYGNSAARLTLLDHNITSFWFHIYGLTNRAYRIETSTNLNSPTNWYPIYTNTVSYWYTNFGFPNDLYRFFRAITNN